MGGAEEEEEERESLFFLCVCISECCLVWLQLRCALSIGWNVFRVRRDRRGRGWKNKMGRDGRANERPAGPLLSLLVFCRLRTSVTRDTCYCTRQWTVASPPPLHIDAKKREKRGAHYEW